jgi:hypothetical protein
MGNIGLSGLYQIAQTHVVEVVFTRRDKNRLPRTRRMLLTLDRKLLNSSEGLKLLHFKKPSLPRAYEPRPKNLEFFWDIIMQDWRAVPGESVNIVRTPMLPLKTYPDSTKFWQYYNLVLSKMTPAEKASFMDR